MSGIVVGGLLGAAAAIYFNRSNRTFSFSGMSSAGQALDNMVEKARSKMMDPDKRSYYGDTSNTSSSMSSSMPSSTSSTNSMSSNTTSTSSSANTGDLGQVEAIVKEDPMLKSQVNSILAENRDTATIR